MLCYLRCGQRGIPAPVTSRWIGLDCGAQYYRRSERAIYREAVGPSDGAADRTVTTATDDAFDAVRGHQLCNTCTT